MFGQGWADQYATPYAAASSTDGTAEELMAFCREIGAVYYEDGPDDECFVVTFRVHVGPELWTENALRKTMKGNTP